MSAHRRPSLWQRFLLRRRPAPGPDFGDMGTAFGLDAITHVEGDWRNEQPVVAPADQTPVVAKHAAPLSHTSSTSKPL